MGGGEEKSCNRDGWRGNWVRVDDGLVELSQLGGGTEDGAACPARDPVGYLILTTCPNGHWWHRDTLTNALGIIFACSVLLVPTPRHLDVAHRL